MGHWNHRVVKKIYRGVDRLGNRWEEIWYGIHEAYYDDQGLVFAITEEPVAIIGDNYKKLKETVEWVMNCVDKPILDYDKIPEEGAENPADAAEEDEDPEEWP